MKKTPITIITGYLGAGKTTLLRRILREPEKKLAIIMNEFGEIGIDTKIIRGKNVKIKELAGGCVCCSLTGEFEAGIKEIISRYKPEWIIVETTGVAEPDAIVFDIEKNLPQVRLDSVITVVDSDSMIRFPSLGHTGRIQIEMADLILLNKVDLITTNQLKEVQELVKSINQKAQILYTTKCNIEPRLLFGIETEKKVTKKEKEHLKNEGIQYFSFSTDEKVSLKKIEKVLRNLPPEIYRAKGFLKTENKNFLFNYVSGRFNFEPFETKKTELVFLGKKISKFKKDIIMEINKCIINKFN